MSLPELSQRLKLTLLASVLKWVIDNSAVEQAGTEEEMAAALQVVASGEVAQLPGQATPAGASTEVSTPVPQGAEGSGAATPAVAAADLVPVPMASDKPAEAPAPDGANALVADAVKELNEAPSEGLIGGRDADVEMAQAKPFVEDQSQLGVKEEQHGMVAPVQDSVPPAMAS